MTPERRVLCPECQRLAVDEVIYPFEEGTTARTASYLCPVGHQFLMRWNTEQPDQKREAS